jgi:hypothetical protein
MEPIDRCAVAALDRDMHAAALRSRSRSRSRRRRCDLAYVRYRTVNPVTSAYT